MSDRRKHGGEDKPSGQMPRKFEEKINNLRRRNEEDRVQYEQLQAELRQLTHNPAAAAANHDQQSAERSQQQGGARQYVLTSNQQQQIPQARMIVANTSGGSVFATNNNNNVACNGSVIPPAATAMIVPGARRASAAPGAYDSKGIGDLYDGQQQMFISNQQAGGMNLPLATISSNYLSVPSRSNQQLLGRSLPDMSSFSMLATYPQPQYEAQQQVFQQQQPFDFAQQHHQQPQHISQFVDAGNAMEPSNGPMNNTFTVSNNDNLFYNRGTSNGSNSGKSSIADAEPIVLNNQFAAGGPVRGVSLSPRRLVTNSGGSDLRAVSPGAVPHPRHNSPGGGAGGHERSSRHFQRHFSPSNAPYTPAASAGIVTAGGSGSGGHQPHHHHHHHVHRQHPYVSSSMHNLQDAGIGGGRSRKTVSPSRYMLPTQQSQQYLFSNVSPQQMQYIAQQHQPQLLQQQQMMMAGDHQQQQQQRLVMMPNNQHQQYLLLPPVDSLSGRRTHSDSALHQTSGSNSGPTTAVYYQQQHATVTSASTFPPPVSSAGDVQQRHMSGAQPQTPADVTSPQRHVVLTSDGYQSVSPPFNTNTSDDGDMLIFDADQHFSSNTNQQFQQQQQQGYYSHAESESAASSASNSASKRLRDNLPDVSISPPQVHEQQQQRMAPFAGPISSAQQQQYQNGMPSQQQQQHSSAYHHMQSSPAAVESTWEGDNLSSSTLAAPVQQQQGSTGGGLNISGSLPDLSQHHQFMHRSNNGGAATTATTSPLAHGGGGSGIAGGGGMLSLRDPTKRSQSGVFLTHHAPTHQQQLYHHHLGDNIPLANSNAYRPFASGIGSGTNVSSSIPDIVIGENLERGNAKAAGAPPSWLLTSTAPTAPSAAPTTPSSNQHAYRQQYDRYASLSPAVFPDQHLHNPPLDSNTAAVTGGNNNHNNMDYSSNSNENSCSSYADNNYNSNNTPPVVVDARKEHAVSLIRQQLESVSVASQIDENDKVLRNFGQPASAPAATSSSKTIRTDSTEVTLELLGQIAAAGSDATVADHQHPQQQQQSLPNNNLLDSINVDDMIADFMLSDDVDAAAFSGLGVNFEDWPNNTINVVGDPHNMEAELMKRAERNQQNNMP